MDEEENDRSTAESSNRKQRLGQLIERGVECKETLKERSTKESLDIITGIIQECNDIRMEGKVEDRIGHTTEVVMDAHIVSLGYKMVKNMLGNVSPFNDQAYASAILKIVKEDGSGWDRIAEMACKIARTVRVKSSMLGAIEPNPRLTVCKERQKRKRVTAAEAVPETLTQITRNEKGAEKVNIVYKQIVKYMRENKLESIPYYKLIIDPANFMNTVENAFQISFMVKENSIMLCKGQDGYPEVRLKKPSDNLGNSQNICSLNTGLCKKFIEIYGIKQPILNVSAET